MTGVLDGGEGRRTPFGVNLLEKSADANDTDDMSGKRKRGTREPVSDLSSREAVERFRESAAEFTKAATRSKESAMKVLVDSGIYTGSGKLTKNYRP